MESKVHPANQNSGHHFMCLDNYNIQQQMKQSGFNAEQINNDKYLESKNCSKIKITIYHNKTKTVRLSNQRVIAQEEKTYLSKFSTLFIDLRLVVSIQTNHTCHFTSTQLREHFLPIWFFFLIEPMLILHSWGRVS